MATQAESPPLSLGPITEEGAIWIEYMDIRQLAPDPQNPKDHDVGALTEAFGRFGYLNPMGLNEETGMLIYGHGRLKTLLPALAAGQPPPDNIVARHGTWYAPVVRGVHLDPESGLAYILADNQLTYLGGWHEPELLTALESLVGLDSGGDGGSALSGTGFDLSDMDALRRTLFPDEIEVEPQIEQAAKLGEKWETEAGQIWEIPSSSVKELVHRFIIGDCTDTGVVADLMGDQVAGSVLTDPPYGVNREGVANDNPEQLAEFYEAAIKALPMADGAMVSFQNPHWAIVWLDAIRATGHRFERILWHYRRSSKTYPWRGWTMASDAIVLSSIGEVGWPKVKQYVHDTYVKMHIEDDKITGLHPTIKPMWVCADLIRHLPEGIVFDGFLGSGSTLFASEQVHRACYGVELDPGYAGVILERAKDSGMEPEQL